MSKLKTRAMHLAEIDRRSAEPKASRPETPRDLLRTLRHSDKPKALPVSTGNGGPRLGSDAEEAVALARMMFGRRYRTELGAIQGVSARMFQHYEKGQSDFQNQELANFRRAAHRHWERLGEMLGIAR